MRALAASLIMVSLGLISACKDSEASGGSGSDGGGSVLTGEPDSGAGVADAGDQTKGEDSGATLVDAGGDAGSLLDAAVSSSDAGSDASSGNFSFIEAPTTCDKLPGSVTDDDEGVYKGVCVAVDWTDNPCSLMEAQCPNGLFFDWKDEEGGYFNLKIGNGGDVVSATAGTVNAKPMGVQGVPASVSDLPEGEDVMVQVLTLDSVRYNVEFRRDGNVITINYIIKLAM